MKDFEGKMKETTDEVTQKLSSAAKDFGDALGSFGAKFMGGNKKGYSEDKQEQEQHPSQQ